MPYTRPADGTKVEMSDTERQRALEESIIRGIGIFQGMRAMNLPPIQGIMAGIVGGMLGFGASLLSDILIPRQGNRANCWIRASRKDWCPHTHKTIGLSAQGLTAELQESIRTDLQARLNQAESSACTFACRICDKGHPKKREADYCCRAEKDAKRGQDELEGIQRGNRLEARRQIEEKRRQITEGE